MPETFPDLDTQTLLYWEHVPDLARPLVEVFSSSQYAQGEMYFVQMFSVEGFGIASKCVGENETRTTYTLWTRGLELPEDVFRLGESKEEK